MARLALSSACRDAADFVAGGVPTVSDEYGDTYDYVDHAARLLSMAQDVVVRAVVYQAGTEERMVSANLPEHTPVTEMNSLTRTAAYLIQRGTEATAAEWDAYETRKKTLLAILSQAM